jgi:hypothetical protein
MKIEIGKLGRTWYNIIKMDLEEIGRQDVYYIHLQLHWLHCTTSTCTFIDCTVRVLMNLHDPQR